MGEKICAFVVCMLADMGLIEMGFHGRPCSDRGWRSGLTGAGAGETVVLTGTRLRIERSHPAPSVPVPVGGRTLDVRAMTDTIPSPGREGNEMGGE